MIVILTETRSLFLINIFTFCLQILWISKVIICCRWNYIFFGTLLL